MKLIKYFKFCIRTYMRSVLLRRRGVIVEGRRCGFMKPC